MIEIFSPSESTGPQEGTCFSIALGLHILALLWNPTLMKSDWHPTHDYVTVDVVEQTAPGAVQPETVKKMTLMDTLKDMLSKPKTEEIAHVAPEPVTSRVAAPIQPALKERAMAHPIATMFQPKSQAEDLAAASAPNAIQTQARNVIAPNTAPSLTSKSFGGIRQKDLPFQMSNDQDLAGGNASIIPVAVGNRSAKSALGYSDPSLKDSGKQRVGILSQKLGGPASDMSALGAGAPSTIALSGTGGTGNAPTGATRGSAIQDRSGSGSGGLVSRSLFGASGGVGAGITGIPSAAANLDQQLNATTATSGQGKLTKKGFDIAGPLNDRPIVHKIIPQYPAWAEEQGIIGSVRIWFTVTPEGTVRTNMRVTKTTGYPDLDKLALDALKQWQFAPFQTSDESSQWGIITFTFSLSS